jgi:hypothetical protein
MRKILVAEFVFALALSFNMNESQKVEAGPFYSKGIKFLFQMEEKCV